jgi:biphenyl-2,3-diol 1,2-dioxygenase
MQVAERGEDGTVYLRMDEYHHRIALHPSGEDDVLYIELQSPTHSAYEAGKTALRAAGVSVVQGTPTEIANRRVIDLVKFETGDLPFELSVGPNTRWHPPFQPARPMSGFKTGPLGLGHVVVRCTGMDESVRLLTNALGFRISDYIGSMVFLRCNPRHHSIAFQPHKPVAEIVPGAPTAAAR